MTAIESLMRSRAGLKAQLTTVKKNFDALADEYPELIVTNPNDEQTIKRYLEKIRNIEAKFDDTQTKIEAIVDVEALEKQYMERADFDSDLDQYISSMTTVLDATRKATERKATTKSAPTMGLHLPAIDLPKFNGDPEHWIGFRDTFESLIHNRDDLGDIQKFHYLKSSLGSSLPELFENLQFSSANYKEAWLSLCERFDDVNLLADVHLRAILHMIQMQQESATSVHRIVDTITNRLKALKSLGFPTEHWGAVMKFVAEEKLHPNTRDKWDEAKCAFRKPAFEDLLNFLKARANNLQAKEVSQSYKSRKTITDTKITKNTRAFTISKAANCSYCENNEHSTFGCPQFKRLEVKERLNYVNQKRLCLNCLKPGHMVRSCSSTSCRICNRRHNTLLHAEEETSSTESSGTENVVLTSKNGSSNNQVLLSTVSIKVLDHTKKPHIVRALLDVGSQSSFITHALSKSLNLNQTPTHLRISGINETHSETRKKCVVEVLSNTTKFSMNLDCLIVPRITGHLPNFEVDRSSLKIPPNIKLADPNFHKPGTIDILIGADMFYEILCIGQIRTSAGPILQQTRFGWVIGGPLHGTTPNAIQCNISKQDALDKQVARFSEIEEFPDTKPLSTEKEETERHFSINTVPDNAGRITIRIPLKTNPEILGESRDISVKHFVNTERKLKTPRNITYDDPTRQEISSECYSYIAAFRRYVSRRGIRSQVYSDNGTNFIGAHAELQTFKSFLKTNKDCLKECFEHEDVHWSLIPPHSPHFGGLWEVGLKSTKHPLIQVARNSTLIIEQYRTFLVQIEALLNSRPMHPLSSDPSDLQPITPGHFLIGRALMALPDDCLSNVAENRLKLYQRLQQLLQHFWSRWYHEYIAELQQRAKWTTDQRNLQKDDLVIIKEDNLPLLRWALGRIIDLHPGNDGIARVATVRTKGGLIKRPIVKLCRLPNQENVGAPQPESSNGGSMLRPTAREGRRRRPTPTSVE